MKIRLAVPEEAEECWNIRNLSIREGCKPSYSAKVLEAGHEAMPEHYREIITENPFFLSSCQIQDWWQRGIWILPRVA